MAVKDYEAAKLSYEEVLEELVESLPPEKRLRGLTLKQRLAGLTTDEIIRALSPEEREELAKKLH